jgi:hypothetical protein
MDFCCKAQLVGIDHFVRCLEEPPSRCSFSTPIGNSYLCQFPLFKKHDKGSQKLIQEDLSITMEH